jgi:hypothetical protein
MAHSYRYLGPDMHRLGAGLATPRWPIERPDDVSLARTATGASGRANLTCTFVVDRHGHLWIADRQSEHVACARGEPVLSAGEISFAFDPRGPFVTAVTNQSTGYCPEPASWPSVAAALDRAGLRRPAGFTSQFVFRRCEACGATNLVKDDWYVCGVCDAPLPPTWNVDPLAPP